MKVLITGAFGNIGETIVKAFYDQGISVYLFDLPQKESKKKARLSKYASGITYGNICNPLEVKAAVKGMDVVVHMAAVIPPVSESKPELCMAVNVDGTANIVRAIEELGNKTKLLFMSSASVMGNTQDQKPPVKVTDHVKSSDNYTSSKIIAEELIEESTIGWSVFRLGGVMNTSSLYSLKQIEYGFEVPYRARFEMVVDRDIATAAVNAVKIMVTSSQIDSGTFFIGGGSKNGWQIYNNEFMDQLLGSFGLLPLAKESYTPSTQFFVDWLDTEASQRVLNYQNTTVEEFHQILRKRMGLNKAVCQVARLFAPMIRWFLHSRSPYYKSVK